MGWIDDDFETENVDFTFSATDLSATLGSDIVLPRTFRQWKTMDPGPLKDAIQEAMATQVKSLENMGSWKIVELLAGHRWLPGKWVYDKKVKADGSLDRIRARWVICGNFQDKDNKNVYAAVANLVALRVFLTVVAVEDLELHQIDVITAFLNAFMDQPVYVHQPYGFEDGTGRVCQLLRALYGLRDSPLLWYKEILSKLTDLGFKPLAKEPCILIHPNGIMLLLYVDDMLIACSSKDTIEGFKAKFRTFFDIKDLGEARQFLGFEIIRNRDQRKLWISQSSYMKKIISGKGIVNATKIPAPANDPWPPEMSGIPKTTAEMYDYQSNLGKIWWIANGTRPDIATAASRAARDQQNASDKHDQLLRSIQRYLAGTTNLAICIGGPGYSPVNLGLAVYCDASFADCKRTSKSTAGYVVMCAGAPILWKSGLQSFVATSTYEAEWTNLMPGGKALLYVADLLAGLGVPIQQPHQVYTDSMNALNDCKSGRWSPKLRHVKIKHRWIMDNISNGDFTIDYVSTDEMIADGLTKALGAEKQTKFVQMMGLSCPQGNEEQQETKG